MNAKLATILIVTVSIVTLTGCASPRVDWSWGPVAPLNKSSRAMAAFGQYAITVGGTRWVDAADGTKTKQWLRVVHRLDTRQMTWDALPDYPIEAGYPFAAVVGTKLYAVGGRSADRGNAETYIMDLSAAAPQWTAGPAQPMPRWASVGGVANGVIYIIGGRQGDPSKKDSVKPAPDVLALDTAKPEAGWQVIAQVPAANMAWPGATVCANKLFLFAGIGDAAKAFSLDLTTRKWSKIKPLPVGLSSGAVTSIGDKYLLISGGSAQAAAGSATHDGKQRRYIAANCFIYDVAQDTYSEASPLIQAVLDQGLVVIDDMVISTGGEESPHRSRTDLVQVGKLH